MNAPEPVVQRADGTLMRGRAARVTHFAAPVDALVLEPCDDAQKLGLHGRRQVELREDLVRVRDEDGPLVHRDVPMLGLTQLSI